MFAENFMYGQNVDSPDDMAATKANNNAQAIERLIVLHRLCDTEKPEWDEVFDRVSLVIGAGTSRAEFERKVNGWIPLQLACRRKPPPYVVKALLDAAPGTVRIPVGDPNDANVTQCAGSCDDLPLHIACDYGASTEVIQILIDRDKLIRERRRHAGGVTSGQQDPNMTDPNGDKDSRVVPGSQMQLPLHKAFCNFARKPPSIEVVQALLESDGYEDVARTPNAFRDLPIHNACETGASKEVIQLLLDADFAIRFGRTEVANSDSIGADNGTAAEVSPPHIEMESIPAERTKSRIMSRVNQLGTQAGEKRPEGRILLDPNENIDCRNVRGWGGRIPLQSAFQNVHGQLPDPDVVSQLITPESLKMCDERNRTVFHSLAQYSESDRDVARSCLSILLEACEHTDQQRHNIHQTDSQDLQAMSADVNFPPFLRGLISLPLWLRRGAFIQNCIKRSLNEKIVSRFLTFFLVLDFVAQVVVIYLFSITSKEYIEERFSMSAIAEKGKGGVYVVVSLELYLLLRSFMKVSWGGTDLCQNDCWVGFEIIGSIIVLAAAFVIFEDTQSSRFVQVLMVIANGVVWMKFVSFLRSQFIDFTVFVTACVHVFWKLIPFLIASVLLLSAFAQMYFIDYVGSPTCINQVNTPNFIDATFCTLDGSYLKVFTMFVSQTVDEEHYKESRSSMSLSIVFAFLVAILLFNILIAVVWESYGQVLQYGEHLFWLNRLQFVANIDSFKKYCCCCSNRKPILYNKSELEPAEDILWEILLVAFADTKSIMVLKKKMELERRWGNRSEGFLSFALGYFDHDPVGTRLKRQIDKSFDWSNWGRRMLFLIFIPLWLIIGVLTIGLAWPMQVRIWFFCPNIESPLIFHRKKD